MIILQMCLWEYDEHNYTTSTFYIIDGVTCTPVYVNSRWVLSE